MVDFQLEPSVNRGKSQIHGGSQLNSEKQQSLRSRSISARSVQNNSQIVQSSLSISSVNKKYSKNIFYKKKFIAIIN